jgi:hypothetical protein
VIARIESRKGTGVAGRLARRVRTAAGFEDNVRTATVVRAATAVSVVCACHAASAVRVTEARVRFLMGRDEHLCCAARFFVFFCSFIQRKRRHSFYQCWSRWGDVSWGTWCRREVHLREIVSSVFEMWTVSFVDRCAAGSVHTHTALATLTGMCSIVGERKRGG